MSTEQLILHVLAYAEVLFRWKLLHKRIELLKAVDPFLRSLRDPSSLNVDHSELGVPFLLFGYPVILLTVLESSSKQAYLSCAPSAVSRQLLGLNRLALHVARVSECPDVLYAGFPSKARLLISSVPAAFSLTQEPFLRSLLPLLGMSSRQPSILLEVASECYLHNWLFMPLPCYGSGLAG